MKLTKTGKESLFQEYSSQKSAQDTGAVESQVALFTYRIKYLTEHLKSNKKDHSSRLGLTKLVGKRKRLLAYLKCQDTARHQTLLTRLGLKR